MSTTRRRPNSHCGSYYNLTTQEQQRYGFVSSRVVCTLPAGGHPGEDHHHQRSGLRWMPGNWPGTQIYQSKEKS